MVAIPNEPYSVFQVELRRRFAGTPLLVLGVTNRTMGYLSPEETYGTGLYQEQQSPFAPGCLEQTIEAAATALEELRERPPSNRLLQSGAARLTPRTVSETTLARVRDESDTAK